MGLKSWGFTFNGVARRPGEYGRRSPAIRCRGRGRRPDRGLTWSGVGSRVGGWLAVASVAASGQRRRRGRGGSAPGPGGVGDRVPPDGGWRRRTPPQLCTAARGEAPSISPSKLPSRVAWTAAYTLKDQHRRHLGFKCIEDRSHLGFNWITDRCRYRSN